jgi:putative transposase
MADVEVRSDHLLNWLMKRTNTFVVRPLSDNDEQVLRDLLDASAAFWNEINYQRLMRYNDEDGFEGDVWDADSGALEGKYKDVLGASTAQTVRRANSEAWRGFFENKKAYHDESNTQVTEHPQPPGFRGNEDDGRLFKGVVRKDAYSVEWGDCSRLEIVVGEHLRNRHNSPKSRLRLEIVGDPNWPDYEDQGRLELWYDETDSTFRASQPVTVSKDARDTPLANEKAALDIGANNLVACTTTTGEQYLYEGRELFQRFRETTREIARLQCKLPEGRYSSDRIRRLYRKRTRRRDHAQEALCRDLLERLYEDGIDTVYLGGLTDVLETYWSVETNAKTHNFWAFKQFTDRLACTAEEYGISVEVRSEAWTSQESVPHKAPPVSLT